MKSGIDRHARMEPLDGAASAGNGVQDPTAECHAPTLLLLREWLIAVSADAHRAKVLSGGPTSGVQPSGGAHADLDPAG